MTLNTSIIPSERVLNVGEATICYTDAVSSSRHLYASGVYLCPNH